MDRERTLDCAVCDVPVLISDRGRFLEMVRNKESPLCRQCRRYCERLGDSEMPGTARKSYTQEENEVTKIELTRRKRCKRKKRKPLASRKITRIVRKS